MNKLLLKGTLLLTLTGFATRFIGFFYRIFLSRTFGAEGMGIYQLVNPVLALTFSLCAAGIQTSISKYVANETSTHNYRHSLKVLLSGLLLSLILSTLCMFFLLSNAEFIAVSLLHEERTAPLIRIVALSVPFASLHSCINGYYYGIRKTGLPAFSQLFEQIVRVLTVFLLYRHCIENGYELHISCAVFGLLAGEIASSLLCTVFMFARFGKHLPTPNSYTPDTLVFSVSKIVKMAAPLSASRIVINFLASVEAVLIPLRLTAFGLSYTDALSIYGILTGMALPFILFPSTLTNSFSVLLLPVISEAQENIDFGKIRRATQKTAFFSLLFGLACCILFLCIGMPVGRIVFHNELAGKFIMILSFLCPFLYLATTMSSILHGLGKTGISFFINTGSLLIRLLFVHFLIPFLGIRGYLYGLLASQLTAAVLNYVMVWRELHNMSRHTAPAGFLCLHHEKG